MNTQRYYYKNLSACYYFIDISSDDRVSRQYIISSNSERARVIATLQDSLRSAYTSENHPILARLATHIDLLAFSITRTNISLVAFALTPADAQNLSALLINHLTEFQQNEQIHRPRSIRLRAKVQPLAGPRNALHMATTLHARHEDWEYDRYSSVGFYLHGRRGDWMRLWRVTSLYGNNPNNYRSLLLATITKEYTLPEATLVT